MLLAQDRCAKMRKPVGSFRLIGFKQSRVFLQSLKRETEAETDRPILTQEDQVIAATVVIDDFLKYVEELLGFTFFMIEKTDYQNILRIVFHNLFEAEQILPPIHSAVVG